MREQVRQWISAISRGDESAFKEFFNYYHPRLYGYALTMIQSHNPSEEVVSDVFMKVWTGRKRLSAIENVNHYMFRAVKNQALNYLEKRKLETVDLDKVQDNKIGDFIQPDLSVLNRELADQIQSAIESLPPRSKLIFGLIRIDGMKYKEVAEHLDLSVKTVENQMTIAIKKLREELSPYFKDNPQKLYFFLLSL